MKRLLNGALRTKLEESLVIEKEYLIQWCELRNHERILEIVKINAEVATPVSFAHPICRDKDDDKFLAAALGGAASFIVSGDDDLLVLNGHQNVQILKPKAFLSELK